MSILHLLSYEMFIIYTSTDILPGNKSSVTCKFEDDFLCGYSRSKAGDLYWQLVSGNMTSMGTGPGAGEPSSNEQQGSKSKAILFFFFFHFF